MSWKSRTAQTVAHLLWENGAVLLNFDKPFLLNSGRRSPVYLDCRKIPSIPTLFKHVAALLHDLVEQSLPVIAAPTCVVGIESSGIPFATAVAMSNHWPLCYVRKQTKDHGAGKLVEGILTKQCALIDDVITTGKTRSPAVSYLEEAGVNIFVNAVIVDRRARPGDDCRVKSLTTMTSIIEHAPSDVSRLWKWWEQEQKSL